MHLSRVVNIQQWVATSLHEVAAYIYAQAPLTQKCASSVSEALIFLAVHNAADVAILGNVLGKILVPTTTMPPNDMCESMKIAFQALISCFQAQPTVIALNGMTQEEQAACCARQWVVLSSLKSFSPAAKDAFLGVYASAAYQLCSLATRSSLSGEAVSSLALLLRTLCNEGNAAYLVQCLVANPEKVGRGAKGVKEAVEMAAEMLKEWPSALITACAELLAPAMNAALATRMEALDCERKMPSEIVQDYRRKWRLPGQNCRNVQQ